MKVRLEKHVPTQNIARYYNMSVSPNLFGEWTLRREWGRIGWCGQSRMDLFADETNAIAALTRWEAAKRRRGYWVEDTRDRLRPSAE